MRLTGFMAAVLRRRRAGAQRPGSWRAVLLMLLAASSSVGLALAFGRVGLPGGYGAGVVFVGLVYVAYVGHRAMWQKPLLTIEFSVGDTVAMSLPIVLVLAMSLVVLLLAGELSADTVSLVGLCGGAYLCLWMIRGLLADSPRVQAARSFLWFLVVIGLVGVVAYAAGLNVKSDNVDSFYGTAAEVGAALLLAAAFQSAWARRVQALEGMVFVTVAALAGSLASCLIVLARGGDGAILFALTVGGFAGGVLLVGVGVVQQLAPDLLKDFAVRGEERLVADELRRHDWSVSDLGRRRGFGYDMKATRAGKTIYVVVTSSPVTAQPKLSEPQSKRARRHRDAFVLAIVDHLGCEWQCSWFVRDPTVRTAPFERAVPAPPLCRLWLEGRGLDAAQL